jgi:hypothetical protein
VISCIKNNPIKLILLTILGLNYLGFCFKELKYISDQEKIRIVVAELLKIQQKNIADYRVDFHPYKSVDDFLSINKNCCEVSGGGFFGGITFEWAYRLCGRLADYVYISETSRYSDKEMIPDNSWHILAISNCGEIATINRFFFTTELEYIDEHFYNSKKNY